MKLKSGATSCPHCGNNYAFYVLHTASGSVSYFYGFNGGDVYNSNMWDGVYLKPKKTAYCGECQRSLGSVVDD